MQIQWAINSYQARALPLSGQRLVNFYAEAAPKDAKDPVVLYGTPGIKKFCDGVGDGPIRGFEVMDGLLYVVSGCTLFSVDKDCVITPLGSIKVGGAGEPGSSSPASATIAVTAGTEASGNEISSITVDGAEITGPVDFDDDNGTTVDALVAAINGFCKFEPVAAGLSKDVSSESGIPGDVAFHSDGTKMFISTSHESGPTVNASVYQYNVSNPWVLDTGVTYDNVSLDLELVNPSHTGHSGIGQHSLALSGERTSIPSVPVGTPPRRARGTRKHGVAGRQAGRE